MNRSRLGTMLARLRSSRTVMTMSLMLGLIAVIAVAGPVVSPHEFQNMALDLKLSPPALEDARWFGTDEQ